MKDILTYALVISIVIVFWGCGEDVEEDRLATVKEVIPAEGSEIGSNSEITIKFDQPVTKVTINGISAAGSGTMWMWKVNLKPYSTTLNIEWTNKDGSISIKSISYIVYDDGIAEDINKGPIVAEMIPPETLAANGVVIITFTHIMNPESVFIRVGDTDGTVTTDDNATFTWIPVADMPLGPTKIVVYGEDANHLPFVAATPEEPAMFDITVVEADTTPPVVIETIPAQDETVDVRERITIKFSESIRHNFTAKIHSSQVRVHRTFRGRNVVKFYTLTPLKPGMSYTLELRGVMDYTGNLMPVYRFRFKAG